MRASIACVVVLGLVAASLARVPTSIDDDDVASTTSSARNELPPSATATVRAARPMASPSHATTNATDAAVAPRGGCGFLWLSDCPSFYNQVVECRCASGCGIMEFRFTLWADMNPGYCLSRNDYNTGDPCSWKRAMKFKDKATVPSKTGYSIIIYSKRWKPVTTASGAKFVCRSG